MAVSKNVYELAQERLELIFKDAHNIPLPHYAT